MNVYSWNMLKRTLCRRADYWLALALAILLGYPLQAAQGIDPELDDILLTYKARKVLAEDAQLAPFNIGVKVQNRVAVLWGPIPSKVFADRAVKTLKALIELAEIQNDLKIETEEFPAVYLPLEAPGESKPPSEPQEIPRTSSPPGQLALWITLPHLSGAPGQRTSESQSRKASVETVPLKPETQEQASEIRQSEVNRENELDQIIREIQHQQQRFATLRWEIQGSRVHLKGSEEHTAALHEFAQTIARLPGVERVTLQAR